MTKLERIVFEHFTKKKLCKLHKVSYNDIFIISIDDTEIKYNILFTQGIFIKQRKEILL